jgi:hypothetical protein
MATSAGRHRRLALQAQTASSSVTRRRCLVVRVSIRGDQRGLRLKWFAEMMLAGLPEPVAGFKMECKFMLEKTNSDCERMVVLRNVVGERREMVSLPSEFFAQPGKFREWCLKQGPFEWKAGEKELQDLHEDINRSAAWRKVKQVPACGWHELGGTIGEFGNPDQPQVRKGIWFLGDAAYDPHGNLLSPDEFGIYWYEGQGYLLGERGRESKFLQDKPKMRPDFAVTDAPLKLDKPPVPTEGGSSA